MQEITESNKYHNALPGELTGDDIENARQFLDNIQLEELDEWTEKRKKVYQCDGQLFRMVIDRPSNGSDKAVVVLSEYGTNILPRLIAKSRIIRDTVDPRSTLVIQPSSVHGEPNMNYSSEERARLYSGDLSPASNRIATVLKDAGNPEDVVLFGSSQGASIGLDYANRREMPASVAVVESVNVVDRTIQRLGLNFMRSGNDLAQAVQANFVDHNSPIAELVECDAASRTRMAEFILRSLHPDNIATIGALRYASAETYIEGILDKGGSVVHAWGDQDKVSPSENNQTIAEKFESNPRYASRILRGLSHAATDFYALDGALARIADNLRSR